MIGPVVLTQSILIDARSSEQGVVLKADGSILHRMPLIRANRNLNTSSDEEDENISHNSSSRTQNVVSYSALNQVTELKALAEARRTSKPSPMAIATEEARDRLLKAQETGSSELETIKAWDLANDQLNKQRDDMIIEAIKNLNLLIV